MKMKYVILVIFVLCMLVNAKNDELLVRDETQTQNATNGTCGTDMRWSFDESEGILVIEGNGNMTNYTKSLHAPWYNISTLILSVEIKEGAELIGDFAFAGCSSMSSVSLPTTLQWIGISSFEDCSGLKSIEFPSNVSDIGEKAFYRCSNLSSVEIPPKVTMIKHFTFERCSNLQSVSFPPNVTYFGVDAFSYTAVKNLTLPPKLERILDYCFDGCFGLTLTSPYFPMSLVHIGPYAFFNCASLQAAIFLSNSTKITTYAFSRCYGMKTLVLPSEMTYIPTCAFCGCGMESLVIPPKVTYLNERAFSGCPSLKSVTLPPNVTLLGKEAFGGCSHLEFIVLPDGLETIGQKAFSECNLSSITIPASVKSIGSEAFAASKIKSVTYLGAKDPNTLNAFSGYLKYICVPPDYANDSFCGKSFVSKTAELDVIRSLEDHCFEAVCNGTEFYSRKRVNATLWESQSDGCVEYQCHNEFGPISWSMCNDTHCMKRACDSGVCVDDTDLCVEDNPYPNCFESLCMVDGNCTNSSLYDGNRSGCIRSIICEEGGWKEIERDCKEEVLNDIERPTWIDENTASCYEFKCLFQQGCNYTPHDECGKICNESFVSLCLENFPKTNCSRYTGCTEFINGSLWMAACEYVLDPCEGGYCNENTGVCEYKEEDKEGKCAVEIDIDLSSPAELNTAEALEVIKNLTGIDTSKMKVEVVFDANGNIVKIVIYCDEEQSATEIENAIENLEKKPDCGYGFLCLSRGVRIKVIPASLSSAPRLLSYNNSLFFLISLFVGIMFSTMINW